MNPMSWFILCLVLGSAIFLAYGLRRKWIAPWREVEELIRQIGQARQPRTFLVDGGPVPRRVGIALEEIFLRQQNLQRQIGEQESGARTLLGAMQDGLLVVDAGRRVLLTNPAFQRLFSLREVTRGAQFNEVVREVTLSRLIVECLQAEAATRGEIATGERKLEVNAVPMKDATGHVTGAVILFHDITQLKQLDEVRKDFVANVSHELRTPLSILRGYIETLRDNPETSAADLTRILEVMERHSKRLGLLVEDLLTLARLESVRPNLELKQVALGTLFGEVARDWGKQLAPKHLKISVDLPRDLPPIRADETRLQEVLYNLLDNAVKYSREGGEIRLSAEQRGNEMALSVGDAGPGIARDDLPRIFERFYRADKARSAGGPRGTGLGLSIVKHIAQLHGGRVEAESEPGRGTTVRVLLPMNGSGPPAAVTQT